MKRYLIIGSGPAGATATETLWKLDGKEDITVISDEGYPYYRREHLARLISGDKSEEELFEKGKDFYKKMGVNFVGGTVLKVSSEQNQVTLTDGRTLDYDSLLIATGGKPIVPPWRGIQLEGVSTFYNLDDARRVTRLARKAKNVAVIGGGTIALKMIPHLRKIGINVSVVEKADRLWSETLDNKASKIIEERLRREGTELWFNEEVVELEGENARIKSVVLKNGQKLPCDLAIITVGIRPSIAFLEGSGVKTERGVLADQYLRTSIPNIFAAGDVTQTFDPILSEPRLHPSWSYAEEQGEIVAHNMAGSEREVQGVINLFSMGVYDLDIVTAGVTRSDQSFEELSRLSFHENVYRKFLLRENKLIGALIIGKNLNRSLLKQQIRQTILKNAELVLTKRIF